MEARLGGSRNGWPCRVSTMLPACNKQSMLICSWHDDSLCCMRRLPLYHQIICSVPGSGLIPATQVLISSCKPELSQSAIMNQFSVAAASLWWDSRSDEAVRVKGHSPDKLDSALPILFIPWFHTHTHTHTHTHRHTHTHTHTHTRTPPPPPPLPAHKAEQHMIT